MSYSSTVALFVAPSKGTPAADKYCAQSVACTLWIGTAAAEHILEYAQFLDHPRTFPNLLHVLQQLKVPMIHVAASKFVKRKVVQRLMELLAALQTEREDATSSLANANAATISLLQFHEQLPSTNTNVARTLQPLLTKESSLFVAASVELSRLADTTCAKTQEPLALCLALYFSVTNAASTANTRYLSVAQFNRTNFLNVDPTAAETIHVWPPVSQMAQSQTAHKNSLFGILSQPLCTAAGKRCLAYWLAQPLIRLETIQQRQDSVAWLVHTNGVARDALREQGLQSCGNTDVDALVCVLETYQTNDDAAVEDEPRGPTRTALKALYEMYMVVSQTIPMVREGLETALQCTSSSTENQPPALLVHLLQGLYEVHAHLARLSDLAQDVLDLDQAPREFLVRAGYKDELLQVDLELNGVAAELQVIHQRMNQEWARATGDVQETAVRLESSPAEGWQFRLPDSNHAKLLQNQLGDRVAVHRILKNGVYFSNKELRELTCKKQDLLAEYDRYQRQLALHAMQVAATYSPYLEQASELIATLDVLVALAHVAAYNPHGYVRPELTDGDDDGMGIELKGARHPCVELQENIDFIANDVDLVYGESSFLLVTGPNMVRIYRYVVCLCA
jgi:DNA mismatch repair protein MSH2